MSELELPKSVNESLLGDDEPEYGFSADKLANICHLDNHYKESD